MCGQGVVAKNLRDLPSPTLAIVAEQLKLSSIHEGVSDTVKMVTTSMPLASKGGLKNGKHGPDDRGPNVGKAISQRGVPARASITMISSQDSLQSQALFNIKDSNKEDRGDINLHYVSSTSRQTSTSHERIRELEERLATQELDTKEANERYQQDLNAKLVAQQQEIEELRRKQQEELEAVKKDQQDKTIALEKRQQEIDAMLSYLVRKTS